MQMLHHLHLAVNVLHIIMICFLLDRHGNCPANSGLLLAPILLLLLLLLKRSQAATTLQQRLSVHKLRLLKREKRAAERKAAKRAGKNVVGEEAA